MCQGIALPVLRIADDAGVAMLLQLIHLGAVIATEEKVDELLAFQDLEVEEVDHPTAVLHVFDVMPHQSLDVGL